MDKLISFQQYKDIITITKKKVLSYQTAFFYQTKSIGKLTKAHFFLKIFKMAYYYWMI